LLPYTAVTLQTPLSNAQADSLFLYKAIKLQDTSVKIWFMV